MVELAWLPATADGVTALTSRPASCIVSGVTPEVDAEIRLGELAFNSPALLGGQAEKKGLSCGACHQNGRGNPHFQFEAVSGSPGTADVTSGLFSKVRADNVFNPRSIPDLALADGQNQVDRTDRTALAIFVRGQIEEEFSGTPPPARVFEALLTYLENVDATASACNTAAAIRHTWRDDWEDALLASDLALATNDQTEKAFYIRTARTALRRLHDRYPAIEDTQLRKDLVSLSRGLAEGRGLSGQTDQLPARLAGAEDRSLYSPKYLATALQRSGR